MNEQSIGSLLFAGERDQPQAGELAREYERQYIELMQNDVGGVERFAFKLGFKLGYYAKGVK